MNYVTVLQAVNTLFDESLKATLRPISQINKVAYDSFYISTGEKLDDVVCITRTISEYPEIRLILGKGKYDQAYKDALYIAGVPTILYVIPEKVINGEIEHNKETINAIYKMYHFIANNTIHPVLNMKYNTTYARAIKVMPMYLTVVTINSWFTGSKYSDFDEYLNISEKTYREIASKEISPFDALMNYSYICGLFQK